MIWASATLLTPDMEYKKIVMIDSTCPVRSDPVDVDLFVRDFYYYFFPETKGYRLALVTDYCTFYEMWKN